MATTFPPRFEFSRDTFAFANELLWEYRPGATAGKMDFLPRKPRPDYAHRCFVLARAARQFLYHARFDAARPEADEDACRRLVRRVVSRSPRRPCPAEHRIVLPGYACLREFSQAREPLLKSECGGAWRSYVLRSHWRMLFPITRAHQERTFARLTAALQANISPIIHLVTFPSLTINHGMIVFDASQAGGGFQFSAYDPNDPAKPARLAFDPATRTFSLPPNRYWAGGRLNIIEIYRSWWL